MSIDINSNVSSALIGAAVGAIIGFLLTVSLQAVNDWRVRTKALACLRAESAHVCKSLQSLLSVQKIQPTVSLTELPRLTESGQGQYLPHYPDSIAKRVIALNYALKSAESSRAAAADLLENQQSPRFAVHAKAYLEWLRAAQDECIAIRKQLKCEQSNAG